MMDSLSPVDAVLTSVESPGNCSVHMLRNIKAKKHQFSTPENFQLFYEQLRFMTLVTIGGGPGLVELLVELFSRPMAVWNWRSSQVTMVPAFRFSGIAVMSPNSMTMWCQHPC